MNWNDMRELKFRFWDKKTKEMTYDLFLKPTNPDMGKIIVCEIDGFVSMQYIGSEDLSNEYAYEDDMIKYKYYHENGEKVTGIAKIYFDDGCYFLEDIKTKHKYPMYLASLSFEIIGNIHENKDLLK